MRQRSLAHLNGEAVLPDTTVREDAEMLTAAFREPWAAASFRTGLTFLHILMTEHLARGRDLARAVGRDPSFDEGVAGLRAGRRRQ
ncbi:hypothetical protein [Streptomyces sp. NPDC007088]|uniref:hypothetical protein n=1 Tax=Streptomyces sp. NPDC007088 TaxID=3364773 RepID=UPI0036D1402E